MHPGPTHPEFQRTGNQVCIELGKKWLGSDRFVVVRSRSLMLVGEGGGTLVGQNQGLDLGVAMEEFDRFSDEITEIRGNWVGKELVFAGKFEEI